MIRPDTLNPAQRAAVDHRDGPCLCIAGAGSGKTAVLTLRIARLVEDGIPPEQILAVTFTRKAAGEMAERVRDLVGEGPAEAMTIATIHSACYGILRDWWAARGERWAVLAPGQQKRLVRDLLGPPSRENPAGLNWSIDLKLALARIEGWQHALISPQDYRRHYADQDENGRRWAALYGAYEASKQRNRQIDFGDMLVHAYRLLTTQPAVLTTLQDQWRYILVDEAQDNNTAQWEILLRLAGAHRNLFVVGDDWQSIYGWRGAHPERLAALRTMWPETRVIILDTNYRSRPYIVEAGNRVIRQNPPIIDKCLRPARGGDEADRIDVWRAADEVDEAAAIITHLQAVHAEGWAWRDLAILYRTNAQSRAIEEALVRADIPYRIVGAAGFYHRREVLDLLAYLRVAHDPTDADAFARAVMAPARFLGHGFVRDVVREAGPRGDLVAALRRMPLKRHQRPGVEELLTVWDALAQLARPADMLDAVRDLTDYDAWFLRDDIEADAEDRLGNIVTLTQTARQFDTLADFLRHCDRMQKAPLDDDDPHADRVTCSTIHRAKGLEWPGVVLAGWADGLLPHARAESLEEERRLAYVAITRARDRLWITVPETYQGRALKASPYLRDLGMDLDAREAQEVAR